MSLGARMSSTLLALLMIGCGSSGSNTVALEPDAPGNGFTVASSDIDSSQETLRIEEGQTPGDPEVNPNKPDPDLALSLDDGIGRIVGCGARAPLSSIQSVLR